jgi:small subunit ribosomal protein S4
MRKKHSYYALQLREKQKVKRLYGMQEKQFKRFFNLAAKAKGVVGENLIQLLERRLDNVIYRSLFASSRSQGRQIVLHGHLKINGKKINIPSYLVKENDRIEIQGNDAFTKLLKDIAESNSKERSTPDWLVSDQNDLSIKISKLPSREHLTLPVKEQFIVELYSK